jgi:hypothetical protein
MKICFTLILTAFTLFSFAQVKVTFRDSKEMIIKGEKIGSKLEYDWEDPTKVTKKIEYFFSEQKGEYTITFYSTWQTPANLGKLDELQIYTFKIDQFDSNPVVFDKTDDNEKIINYSLMFSAKEETPFKYDVYNIYKSTPERSSSFSTFSVYNDLKEPFLILAEKLKLPETSEE